MRLRWRFIADTPSLRKKGLMFAEPLHPNEAVLFIQPDFDYQSFWNLNVPFGLDLIFLDQEGYVVDLATMKADDPTQIVSRSPAKYVIEAHEGTNNKIFIGDRFILTRQGGKMIR